MTEHNPPEEPEEPTNPDADPVTDETAEQLIPDSLIDDSVSDGDLLAAAEAPYEAPTEPAVAAAPPHQTPPHQPPPHQPPPPNETPPYAQGRYDQAPYGQGPATDRRLFRSRNDRKLGGVAGGIARYLGVDPTVVRIVFVVLALTGTSVLVYLAAWILMPEHPSGQPEPVWRERATDRNLAIAVGLASLGLAVAILNESWLVLAIVLIAGGIWLLSEQPLSSTSDWVSPVPPRPTPAGTTEDATTPAYANAQYAYAGAATTAGAAGGWGWDAPPPPGPSDAVPAEPRRGRGPQRITRAVLSLLAILAAVGIAASAGDWWNVSGTRMLGIAILIIGVGVLVGAMTRAGARGLIPLGILAVILLIPVSAVDGLVDDGVGSTTYRPLTLTELAETYSHGVGELLVDLSRLDLDGETRNLDVDLGIGELTLLLPDEVGGTLDIENMAGEIIVNLPGSGNDFTSEGINQLPQAIRLPGDRGTLVLDVDVDLGVVEVRGN